MNRLCKRVEAHLQHQHLLQVPHIPLFHLQRKGTRQDHLDNLTEHQTHNLVHYLHLLKMRLLRPCLYLTIPEKSLPTKGCHSSMVTTRDHMLQTCGSLVLLLTTTLALPLIMLHLDNHITVLMVGLLHLRGIVKDLPLHRIHHQVWQLRGNHLLHTIHVLHLRPPALLLSMLRQAQVLLPSILGLLQHHQMRTADLPDSQKLSRTEVLQT